jgi:hypothetical protein
MSSCRVQTAEPGHPGPRGRMDPQTDHQTDLFAPVIPMPSSFPFSEIGRVIVVRTIFSLRSAISVILVIRGSHLSDRYYSEALLNRQRACISSTITCKAAAGGYSIVRRAKARFWQPRPRTNARPRDSPVTRNSTILPPLYWAGRGPAEAWSRSTSRSPLLSSPS